MKKRNLSNVSNVMFVATVIILSAFAVTAGTNEQKTDIVYNLGSENRNEIKSSSENFASIDDRNLLWDNGDTDGIDALSHAAQETFGYRRSLLDDFRVTATETWVITGFHSYNLWPTMPPGSGTDFNLSFWSDNSGSPDAEITVATTVSYTEVATGRQWFGADEVEISYEFEPVILTEGVYWIHGNVDGPENCFWLAKENIWRSECWADYEDSPPIQPGSDLFGHSFDVSYKLTGSGNLEPDLDCSSVLSWIDVEPGTTISGEFSVENIGDEGSLLNWEIESYPDWGSWSFNPEFGAIYEEYTVDVEVVVPDEKETEFFGEIVLINSDDPDDICIIDISLATPESQQSLISIFFEQLAERFPFLILIRIVYFVFDV